MENLQRDPGEVSIDFTEAELVVLAGLVGTTPFPPSIGEALSELGPAAAPVEMAVRDGLLARRLLLASGSEAEPIGVMRQLFEFISSPGVVAELATRTAAGSVRRLFAGTADIVIEHRPMADSVWRLTPLPGDQLIDRIVEASHLVERPTGGSKPFRVSSFALLHALQKAEAGEESATIAELVDAGVPASEAAGFARAAVHPVVSVAVSLLYRPDADQVVGRELAWVDGGPAGLWLVPPPGVLTQQMVEPEVGGESEVAPVTRADIIEKLEMATTDIATSSS